MNTSGSTDLEIACGVNKYIFWLEISVYDVEVVKVFKGKHNLRSVETRVRLTKTKTRSRL